MLFATGKPRPGVIVQSDEIETPVDILVCPFTTTSIDAPFYRLPVEPSDDNGLLAPSQLMVDKIGPAPRDGIGRVIGHLSDDDLFRLGVAIVTVFDIGR